ncbi:MAG: glycosyltransferase, partial [Deltaproteobacteria bacterium]|nr:glycosyltransferase [Deltaproteobacteria bacterium]
MTAAAQCSIIIPVYGAFEESRKCLESVLRHSPEARAVFVIDDASPHGEFIKQLPAQLRQDARLVIKRNPVNLGYVKSCNVGMQLACGDDVVLLNSDTEVTAGWLAKLSAAAYSDARVATVTPFTNNGEICSFPQFCADNLLPSFCTLEELGEIVERASKREYPEIPSCVGFCVYIRREAISKIGVFNAEVFESGYGEENDFSCRAVKAGYINIMDDATFIFHKGSLSFGARKTLLYQRNGEALRRLHPHYFDEVARFKNRDPLRPLRLRIMDELVAFWNRKQPRRTLQVLHNGPFVSRGDPLGGTEMHVQDLIGQVEGVSHWSLVPFKRSYFLTAHLPGMQREYVLDSGAVKLGSILQRSFFDLVHLHHTRWFEHAELCAALVRHGNYIVSLHDFTLVCPRSHLVTLSGKFCSGKECREGCGYKPEYMLRYRSASEALLDQAKRVVCFSDSTKDLYSGIVRGDYRWKKIPHGVPSVSLKAEVPAKPDSNNPLKIVFLGNLHQLKGATVIAELAGWKCLPCGVPLEWHLIGKLFGGTVPGLVQHGSYSREELPEKFAKIRPHLVVLLSLCPETYGLILDEAWNAGVPALVTPLGAPPERVRRSGAGWVLENLTARGVVQTLEKIVHDWQGYLRVRANVSNVELLTVKAEALSYEELYAECGQVCPV